MQFTFENLGPVGCVLVALTLHGLLLGLSQPAATWVKIPLLAVGWAFLLLGLGWAIVGARAHGMSGFFIGVAALSVAALAVGIAATTTTVSHQGTQPITLRPRFVVTTPTTPLTHTHLIVQANGDQRVIPQFYLRNTYSGTCTYGSITDPYAPKTLTCVDRSTGAATTPCFLSALVPVLQLDVNVFCPLSPWTFGRANNQLQVVDGFQSRISGNPGRGHGEDWGKPWGLRLENGRYCTRISVWEPSDVQEATYRCATTQTSKNLVGWVIDELIASPGASPFRARAHYYGFGGNPDVDLRVTDVWK